MFTTKLASLFCIFLTLTTSQHVLASDIWLSTSKSGAYKAIVIEGEIALGDFASFKRIVKENNGAISGVYIYSHGGDFYEAMKIGRAVHALELSTQVPMKDESGRPLCEYDSSGVTPTPRSPENCICASAGFFIHIGGVSRGGTFLAVHRPYFSKGKFGQLSQLKAKDAYDTLQKSARIYMNEMEVPQHVQEDVLGTPSDKLLLLDDKTIKTYFWLSVPYRYEWLKNKCSKLSDEEVLRKKRYAELLREATRHPSKLINGYADIGFTDADWDDYQAIKKKEEDALQCEVKVIRESRLAAYKKYFHIQ
jgi:hypothetical protein